MAHLTTLSTNAIPDSWEFVNQQAKKLYQQQNKEIILCDNDLIRHIFGFLSHVGLGVVSCVCREWKIVTSDNFLWGTLNLRNLFPKFQVLDRKVWEAHVDMTTYGLNITEDFQQDKQLIKTLKKFASLKVENDSGITFLTLPEGLTIRKLHSLAQSPKQGYVTQVGYMPQWLVQTFGDISIDKTYRVAITNNVLQGSRYLTVAAHQDLLDILGCKMPKMLAVATLSILTYISSPIGAEPIRLYGGENPRTSSRCSEQVAGINLTVGLFNRQGLHVLFDNSADRENGVAAMYSI